MINLESEVSTIANIPKHYNQDNTTPSDTPHKAPTNQIQTLTNKSLGNSTSSECKSKINRKEYTQSTYHYNQLHMSMINMIPTTQYQAQAKIQHRIGEIIRYKSSNMHHLRIL